MGKTWSQIGYVNNENKKQEFLVNAIVVDTSNIYCVGFGEDEIKYFSEQHSGHERCRYMLRIWLEDDTNTLADLAYTLEGMKMISATDCIKRILEPADKMEDISE